MHKDDDDSKGKRSEWMDQLLAERKMWREEAERKALNADDARPKPSEDEVDR